MWIFGYGSIIWKPGFVFVERHPGFIRGWSRRFYQGSLDHRGVPGRPGRVVTLIEQPQAVCWGMLFRIEGSEAERVLGELDQREQGGYERFVEPVFDHREVALAEALVYVATPANPHYLGAASEAEIARQVLEAVGPSGPNLEYVLELGRALRAAEFDDPHVFAVEAHILALLAGDTTP
ncbi:MAG: gamma-glutamylcyclotransferase [Bradymonadaceae bacterium]|nr:gamma-glutamylcyclotransferase [Lujinxingiaceae bacterium]